MYYDALDAAGMRSLAQLNCGKTLFYICRLKFAIMNDTFSMLVDIKK